MWAASSGAALTPAAQRAALAASARGPGVNAIGPQRPANRRARRTAHGVVASADLSEETSIRRRPPDGHARIGNTRDSQLGDFTFKVGVVDKDGKVAMGADEGSKELFEPRNILEKIVWDKDYEVATRKEKQPLLSLKARVASQPPARDFVGAIKAQLATTGAPALIAEVKKASPSRGVLREHFDPVEIALAYERGGAACLSVLTDEKYFQGCFENLSLIRAAGVSCPLLCKEFVIDAYQIYLARAHGADAVLLIAAVLPNQDLSYLIKVAKVLGMSCLVEVHTAAEMKRVLALETVELIGINNRDLGTFKVDLANTRDLLAGGAGAAAAARGIPVVGESGIFGAADVSFVQAAGCSAVLVGESLVKQADPAAAIGALYAGLRR